MIEMVWPMNAVFGIAVKLAAVALAFAILGIIAVWLDKE